MLKITKLNDFDTVFVSLGQLWKLFLNAATFLLKGDEFANWFCDIPFYHMTLLVSSIIISTISLFKLHTHNISQCYVMQNEASHYLAMLKQVILCLYISSCDNKNLTLFVI